MSFKNYAICFFPTRDHLPYLVGVETHKIQILGQEVVPCNRQQGVVVFASCTARLAKTEANAKYIHSTWTSQPP